MHIEGVGAGTRVSLFICQTLASGMTQPAYTNGEGDAYFSLDTDQFAEAEVYVNGGLAVSRSPIQDTYYI